MNLRALDKLIVEAELSLLIKVKSFNSYIAGCIRTKPTRVSRTVQADAFVADGCAEGVLRAGDDVLRRALGVCGERGRQNNIGGGTPY